MGSDYEAPEVTNDLLTVWYDHTLPPCPPSTQYAYYVPHLCHDQHYTVSSSQAKGSVFHGFLYSLKKISG